MINPTFDKPKIISVSQLNFYVKSLMENDARLNNIIITGEISNLTDHYRSGHIYFSLKDEKSVVRAVMFAGNARNLRFKPQEGMKVIAVGRVSLYEATGSYQLYVEGMQPDGIGVLTMAFEQLKKKLEQQGLFKQEHKKPIPQFPKTVGVITSPTGAVIRDIQNVISRRYPCVEIVLCPTLVQGENAAPQLINAVNLFNEYDLADVIIIGRGGGSIEDLWAFNDENLAYAIYASNIPVISAVGHETDFTICDVVSDLRAPTPSAAAELAVLDKAELMSYYESKARYMGSIIDRTLLNNESVLNSCKSRLAPYAPDRIVENLENKYDNYRKFISNYINTRYSESFEKMNAASSKLESLNPFNVLKRGYSVTQKDGRAVYSSKELKSGDSVELTFSEGQAVAEIKEVK